MILFTGWKNELRYGAKYPTEKVLQKESQIESLIFWKKQHENYDV